MNTTCPVCGNVLKISRGVAVDTDDGSLTPILAKERPPVPGSFSCCFGCITWLRVNDAMCFEVAAPADLAELDSEAPGVRDKMEARYRAAKAEPKFRN